MARPTADEARQRFEAKFTKAQKTTEAATDIVQSDLAAARKKTARLREERLAKEPERA